MQRLTLCLLAFFVMLCSSYQAEAVPITNGLIAYWTGDGTTNDSSSNSNNGTLQNGATFGTGIVNQAFSFNGASYVEVPDNNLWAFGLNDFTIDFWVNFNTSVGGTIPNPGAIFIGQNTGAGLNTKWFFALGGGKLNFLTFAPGDPVNFLAQTTFNPNINQWYNLTIRRSGNTFTVFVDGQAGTSENSNLAVPNVNFPLRIGRNPNEDAGGVNGRMDEVVIYNRALSQNEIQTLASSNVIPEPSTYLLFAVGIFGIIAMGYRQRRKPAPRG